MKMILDMFSDRLLLFLLMWNNLVTSYVADETSLAPAIQRLIDRGVSDWISRIEDGLLVEPGSVEEWCAAMQSLINEPQRVAQLASQIRPPLTVDEHAAQLERLYGETADQHSLAVAGAAEATARNG